jgi:DNA processing protein
MIDKELLMNEDWQERACWLLLTFKCGLSTQVVNAIVTSWCQQQGRSLRAFFAADSQEWQAHCQLKDKVIDKLERVRMGNLQPSGSPQELPLLTEQASLVKQLSYDGIHILTVLDENYPRQIKAALKPNELPPVLFYAGDLHILDNINIAIIGSRNAGEASIMFAREAAQCLAEQDANVISGFARGVDRAAYEGATSTQGYTTVVLPHGINKLSDVQMYSLLPKIVAGKVLLLSQFHPHAPWLVSRAMERNKVVTGLAQVVIVAEANTHGGTWAGAIGALEQKRPVYVCQTESSAPLAGNQALIERGAHPLYWSNTEAVQDTYTAGVLAPLLEESNTLQREQHQKQQCSLTLSHQITHLLKEHRRVYNYH